MTAEYALVNSKKISILNKAIDSKGNQEDISFNLECKKGSKCGPYHVLDTDYTNYAIVSSCIPLGLVHIQWIWILTRAQTYDVTTQLAWIQQNLPRYDMNRIQPTTQGATCTYF